MKCFKLSVVMIMIIFIINASCSSKITADKMGGSCSYVKFEGYAKITSIVPAPESEYNCPEKPELVTFEFTPLDKSDRKKYRFTGYSDSAVNMRINDGVNPSHAWIKNNGIAIGKKFRCFRTELSKGTCTPVIYTFPDLNLFPETGCR